MTMENAVIGKYLYGKLFEGKETSINIKLKHIEAQDAVLMLDGYKHSMVQIIAISIALKSFVRIENIPLVIDTYVLAAIINELGGEAKILDGQMILDCRNVCSALIPACLGNLIHGSMYLCPALIVALHEFAFFGSGGCQIGNKLEEYKRPFKHIISVMAQFGVNIICDHNKVLGSLDKITDEEQIDILRYSDDEHILSGPLVGGATKTAIILSLLKNHLIIKNAFIRTETLDMLRFLECFGKKVEISQGTIVLEGETKIPNQPVCFKLSQCGSEIVTYSTLSILTKREVKFADLNRNVLEKTLAPEINIFRTMGVSVNWTGNNLIVHPTAPCWHNQPIIVSPQSIQSDHHPFYTLLFLLGDKKVKITERVWKDRFQYIDNLIKFGAAIYKKNNSIIIYKSELRAYDFSLDALDTRSGAVTLLAMIFTGSHGTLVHSEHILRGYSRLEEHLKKFGVQIDFSEG